MTDRKLSPVGVVLTLIAFVFFTYFLIQLLGSWALGVPAGLVMTLMACRPAREDGPMLWEKGP